MSDEIKPLGYTLDEAARRLRDPKPSRSTMNLLIRTGLLKVSGWIGDRPYISDEAVRDCAASLPKQSPKKKSEDRSVAPATATVSSVRRRLGSTKRERQA